MKRVVFSLACVMVSLGALVAAQADIFAKLGSNVTEAQEAIFSSFSGGYVYFQGTRSVFKTATPEARAAMVTSVVNFARTYSTSADFAKRYATYREGQKPSPPEPQKTGDQIRAEQKKGLAEGIANLEKMAAQMPTMKKDAEKTIAQLKEQLAQVGANKEQNAQMDTMMKQAGELQATQYKESLAKWEKENPVDSKGMIAGRLRQFLALSATVDFTAATAPTKENPKMLKFVNPTFENKSSEWKYLYRAGKPSVDAARTIAQDWLKALGG